MLRPAIHLSYVPVLLLWAAVAIPFTLRTPDESYSHDYQDHVAYTQFIHHEKRLPHPGEGGGEGHQPPLYYLLASQLVVSSARHVRVVRLFSVFLGALTLLLLQASMKTLGVKTMPGLAALAFCATTPHFLFLFSSYNNDALTIFWAIFLWTLFLRYIQDPSSLKAWGLGALTVAGFFSKFSFGVAWATLVAAALYLVMRKQLTARDFKRFIMVQGVAIIPVLGWIYFHNVQTSGQWTVLNAIDVPLQRLPNSPLETILTPPGFTNREWVTPYADVFLPIGKKNSLTAYAWVTSIFGEYNFRHLQDFWVWFILWVHTLWLLTALPQIRRSPLSVTMGIALVGGWLGLAAFVWARPLGTAMDFRYVAWLWLPLTVLRAQALDSTPFGKGSWSQKTVFTIILLGIVIQWAMISTL